MEADWEAAMGRMVCGIYILTAARDGEINGMTASWVSPVSHAPPLLTVAVHPNRRTHRLIEASGAFAIHCLAREHREWISRFKGPDPRFKFEGLSWSPGITGSPVLDGCPAVLECSVRHGWSPGNHTVFVGEAVSVRLGPEAAPLSTVDYDGVYLGRR